MPAGFAVDSYDTDERWSYPNPTGLEGVMEGFCPPHYPDMCATVEAVCARKFGPGAFRECVALQAQYIFDTFGKFPGTVPSMFVTTYLQAQHLDPEFCDRFYEPGAYLRAHAGHMARWHPGAE